MKIKTYISRWVAGNCHLLIDEDNNSIVVDPCVTYDTVFKNQDSKLKGVFITHGHFDHINCLDSYLNKTDIKFYMHKNAKDKIEDSEKNCSTFTPRPIKFNIPVDRIVFVNENSQVNLLTKKITFIETPGHTDCSICIVVDDIMFSGDTLFKNSIGRTDLYTANSAKMIDSLNKLKNLKINYRVFPGHNEETTLNEEKENNRYLNRS